MEDVQNQKDHRKLPIDQVGVCDLKYPIRVLDPGKGWQRTVASVTMSVSLPHQFKGTHMSRFIEVLNAHCDQVTAHTLPNILEELRNRLDAESARVEVRFSYFLERTAPVSKSKGLMSYECRFAGEFNNNISDFMLEVTVPVTSLCPCSKTISDYGAHNQRGKVTMQVRTHEEKEGIPQIVWIEELVEIAEKSASAPVFPLLKRSDERYLTMLAYDNPVFVEDLVRNVASELQQDPRIKWFTVHAVNQESIHNHGAFARIELTT